MPSSAWLVAGTRAQAERAFTRVRAEVAAAEPRLVVVDRAGISLPADH